MNLHDVRCSFISSNNFESKRIQLSTAATSCFAGKSVELFSLTVLMANGEVHHVPIDGFHGSCGKMQFREVLVRSQGTVAQLAIPQPAIYIGDDWSSHWVPANWDFLHCIFHVLDRILLALVGGEQLEVFGVPAGIQQLEQNQLITKVIKSGEFFGAYGDFILDLANSVQIVPANQEVTNFLIWLKSVHRLMSQPMNAARAADWDTAQALALQIQPPAAACPRLHRNLRHLSETASIIANLFTRYGAPFVPASLSTVPLYGIHGRLKLQHLGSFTAQNVVDYWLQVAANGELREGFTKFGNFPLSFFPLIAGMRNMSFTATNPNNILQLPVANVVSPIPAQLHQLRPHIPLGDLATAYSIARSVTPRLSAFSALINTETFRFVVMHQSLKP